jgi:soluble lytic murein transglycosylase-like protein
MTILSLFPLCRLLVAGCALPVLLLSACTFDGAVPTAGNGLSVNYADVGSNDSADVAPAAMNSRIGRYAAMYRVPESLIRRVIVRESGYNPHARHAAYWGLMQIRYDTAASMGYHGAPAGLLDADTNLRYAVKYLAGAYRVAGGNPDRAIHFYADGYYYDAKRRGMLDEVGLKRMH